MKTLRSAMYKNIASVLVSDDVSFRSSQNMILFSRVLQQFPSKGMWYQICDRLISYYERNINSVSLIIETMRDEGEDNDIVSNIEILYKNPTLHNSQEVSQLCMILNDYVKYAKMLKCKDTLSDAMESLENEEELNIHDAVETLYKVGGVLVDTYNSVNYSTTANTFDSTNIEGMKTAIAQAKDVRSSNKIIITGFRSLNALLSPGYLAGCLYIYMGLPGNYKSGMLLESHIDTCIYNPQLKDAYDGKTPISIYITMENTMAQTVRRLWSLLYPAADMSMFTVDEISEMINNKLTSQGVRSVLLYYKYREKSTADLANIIRSFNTDKTQVVAVFLDYIKRIRPGRTDTAATASEKTELHTIMNELKNLASEFEIPVVTGHQLNRMAAQAIDGMRGGSYGKSAEVLNRSQTGSAWEIQEVADWAGILNIESNGENKMLMIKAVKQRDLDQLSDISYQAIRHPFINVSSFALKPDINETCSISSPVYIGGRTAANLAAINI